MIRVDTECNIITNTISNDMEQHLQQLSGQDDEARDGNNKKVLPKFLAGEEDAMKYIDGHGKKVEEDERKARTGEDGSRRVVVVAIAIIIIINRIRSFTTCT